MVKLPRIRRPRLTGWPKLPLLSSVRGRIIVGFGLLVLILVVVVGASAWLYREHQSAMAEMEEHAATASLLQDAQVNTNVSALLLQRYVVSGDDTLLPEIRSSAAAAVDSLAEARAQEEMAGDDEHLARIDTMSAAAASLPDVVEQIIALRQSGDLQGAAAAVDKTTSTFREFRLALGEVAEQERLEVSALRSRVDRTGDLAFWLLLVSGTIGVGLGLAASALLARSILKPLSSLESAALAVAGGDLEARAPATGPREFARLGASLNRMTDSLLDASKLRKLVGERDQAYIRLRDSEERFRLLVNQAADAIFVADLEGRFIDVNQAACDSLGYTREELLTLAVGDIADGFSPDMLAETLKRVSGGVPITVEGTHRRKDGTTFPAEIRIGLLEIDGRLHMLGLARDVTERKRAEEALRERTHDLSERAKELNCLYGITQLVDEPDVSLEDIVQGTAYLIPPSWQYPEVTCARINLDGQEFRTDNFREAPWSQTADITVHGERIGAVEVCYLEERPESDEGPFLKEERSLINAVARQLGKVIERKQAEEALRESEEWLSTTLTSIGDAVIATGQDGRVTFLNPVAQSLTGWKREDAAGMSLTDILNIVSEQTGKPAENPVARVIREGAVVGLANDTVLIAKDGTRRPIEDSAAPIRDSMGSVIGVVLVFHDVTERKRAEGALRESEKRFRQLVNQAADAIFVADLEGSFTDVNQAACDSLGYTREELLTLSVADITRGFTPDMVEEIFKSVSGGTPMTVEGVHRRKDGTTFPTEIRIGVFEVDGRRHVLGLARDVSERKRVEEELRRLNRELEKDRQEIEALNRSLEKKVEKRTRDLYAANEKLQQRHRDLLDARAQAATDALTDLSNHRAFHERIREEVRGAQETGSPIGLIMLDIDGFKVINDSQGHLAGDEILRGLAQTLADVTPREDAYRYGGDEFAVMLPGVEGRKTARVAERLRRAVERRISNNGESVTVSLGIASFPDMVASADELVYGADAAMYWAKSAGKNRVGDWSKLLGQREGGALPWYAADRGVKAPDVVAALAAALAAKDPTTAGHTERCSWYALKLAEELGLPNDETSIVRLASLLHDIGKLAIPDEVLLKPGQLNEEEWAQMKQHPTAALHVLSHIRSLTDATPAILHHHEHFDGSGYPDGLAGEEIPIASRILLVTDAFDAMTTDRPYRKAMPVEVAIEELKRCSGSQFDPAIVDAFLSLLAREGAQPLRHMATAQARPVAAGAAATSGSGRRER